MRIPGRRAVLLSTGAVVAALVLALVAVLAMVATGAGSRTADAPGTGASSAAARPGGAGTAPSDGLRERLGGLAGLLSGLSGDDPLLTACTAPVDTGPVPTGPAGDEVGTVTAQTEAVRDLTLSEPPEVQLLDTATMADRVADAFSESWDEERLDLEQRLLTALGAIPPGTDLAELRIGAFARQVSGYANADEGMVAVRVGDPAALTPLERVVLAHELEHILTGTHLGRPRDHHGGDTLTTDQTRAFSTVVEGSATLAMLRYATTVLDPSEQELLHGELAQRAGEDALGGFSPYLLAELQFPYLEGVRYACQRWLDGGWAAVDGVYFDPPPSTAAILFPDRHDEQPAQPRPPGEPGEGWTHARAWAFGAAELEWLLAAPGGDVDAALDATRERVAAWDGGEAVVWTRGGESAVGLALVDRGGGRPLCDSVRDWYAAAFDAAPAGGEGAETVFEGPVQDAALACPGDEVRLGIAPSPAEALALTR